MTINDETLTRRRVAEANEALIRTQIGAIEQGRFLPNEFVKLADLIAGWNENAALVKPCALAIHAEMAVYLTTFGDWEVVDGRLINVPGRRSGAAFLERLARVKDSSKLWERAVQKGAPKLAQVALMEAAMQAGLPVEAWSGMRVFHPDRTTFAPLLPNAQQIAAAGTRNAKWQRDHVLVEVFWAHQLLRSEKLTPKPAIRLAWDIDAIYRSAFVPRDPDLAKSDVSIFGGALASKATLEKLLQRADKTEVMIATPEN